MPTPSQKRRKSVSTSTTPVRGHRRRVGKPAASRPEIPGALAHLGRSLRSPSTLYWLGGMAAAVLSAAWYWLRDSEMEKEVERIFAPTPSELRKAGRDSIEEDSMESFPASDSPSHY